MLSNILTCLLGFRSTKGHTFVEKGGWYIFLILLLSCFLYRNIFEWRLKLSETCFICDLKFRTHSALIRLRTRMKTKIYCNMCLVAILSNISDWSPVQTHHTHICARSVLEIPEQLFEESVFRTPRHQGSDLDYPPPVENGLNTKTDGQTHRYKYV